METAYIVKWNDDARPEYRWFIRGLRTDGSFYGEITNRKAQTQSNISGRISRSDYEAFLTIVQDVEASADPHELQETSSGILAKGLVSNPQILLEVGCSRAASSEAFSQIVKILAPYVRTFYEDESV
jgi:hypothetical protein